MHVYNSQRCTSLVLWIRTLKISPEEWTGMTKQWPNKQSGDKDWILSLLWLTEWTWDWAVWDPGARGRDQSGRGEAGGVGGSSARREEPPHHIGWGLCAARASGSGAHHWGLELSLGRHPSATSWSYRCRYQTNPHMTSICVCTLHARAS